MNHVGHRVVAKIQQQLFDKLIGADLAFFHHNSPGTLISHFINDVNLLRNMASNTLTAIGKDSLTALFLIGVMFAEDWLLALRSAACRVGNRGGSKGKSRWGPYR